MESATTIGGRMGDTVETGETSTVRDKLLVCHSNATRQARSVPCGGTSAEKHRKAHTTIQPWREFWPTAPGDDLHLKLIANHRDVLKWKFDRDRLFEQPWREWTNSSYTELHKRDSTRHHSDDRENDEARVVCAHVRQSQNAVDRVIAELNLESVFTPDFYYLERLKLYRFEKPFRCQLPQIEGYRMSNIVTAKHGVRIFNLAGHEDRFNLDEAGFEFTKCPIDFQDRSDEGVVGSYLPQLSAWLKTFLDCQEVFFYAYNFRQSNSTNMTGKDWKPPFFRAHCDASDRTHLHRLELYYGDKWEQLLRYRIRLINVWKPLSTTVQDCPLAMCDFRTVDKDDLLSMDLVYPHLQDEAYEVFYNPNHRWFYKKDMARDDTIVFKLHDTLDAVATVCPHSAFLDPSAPKGSEARASIEVKAIIIG